MTPTCSQERESQMSDDGGTARRQTAQAYLNDSNASRQDVWASLQDLTCDDLLHYEYAMYYLNLFTLFQARRPVPEIRRLAAECTRLHLWGSWEYYCAYLSQLLEDLGRGDKGPAPVLSGWDLELIHDLLRQENGLIICTYHLGAFRFIPSSLAALGFEVHLPIDKATYDQSILYAQVATQKLQHTSVEVQEHDANARVAKFMHLINAECPSASRSLFKALRKNGIVVIYVDGNTGVDGRSGETSRTLLKFDEYRLNVKNGAARLALMSGAPMLSSVALRETLDRGRVVVGEPIVSRGRHLGEQEKEEFVQRAMQALYATFEHYAMSVPEQWEGCREFHRWRVRSDAANSSLPVGPEIRPMRIEELLRAGKAVRLSENRVVEFRTRAKSWWIDVLTLRVYRQSSDTDDLFEMLARGDGVSWDSICHRFTTSNARTNVLSTLAQLTSRGVAVVV